jgi:hypothetical protein
VLSCSSGRAEACCIAVCLQELVDLLAALQALEETGVQVDPGMFSPGRASSSGSNTIKSWYQPDHAAQKSSRATQGSSSSSSSSKRVRAKGDSSQRGRAAGSNADSTGASRSQRQSRGKPPASGQAQQKRTSQHRWGGATPAGHAVDGHSSVLGGGGGGGGYT